VRFAPRCQNLSGIVIYALLSSSCASGVSLSTIRTDEIVTASSQPAQSDGIADREAISDRSTIRNAVSSAGLEQLGGAPLHWENKDTGSRGTVTAIEEYNDGPTICRRFAATRESFEGIAVYRGDTCLGEQGNWWMKDFGPA
jgi:surface antigen